MQVNDSKMIRSRSTQPLSEAAAIKAYSPLT